MNIHIDWMFAVFLVFGASCAALSSYFIAQEIGEVNRKLPDAEQFSYWGNYPGKMTRISGDYRRLYPSGTIDRSRRACEYAAVACMAIAALRLMFVVVEH